MKRMIVLVVFGLIILPLVGCQGHSREEGRVNVTVEGGEFPAFLVGTWEADQHDWAFTFDANGNISTVVHTLWHVPIDMNKGFYFAEGIEEGTFAFFVMGDCEADYDAADRQLKVKIMMDSYEIKTSVGSLTGRSEDYFEGPVSEDGTLWQVRWRGYGYLNGATPPDINNINANPEPLVFAKIESE